MLRTSPISRQHHHLGEGFAKGVAGVLFVVQVDDLPAQPCKMIEKWLFDVVALVELDILGSPVGVHDSSLTTQYPPLAGPIRSRSPASCSFLRLRSTERVVTPTSSESSAIVTLRLLRISVSIFSDLVRFCLWMRRQADQKIAAVIVRLERGA